MPAIDGLGCTGCGRCAADCPTEALALDGLALPAHVPPAGLTLRCEAARCEVASAHTVACPGAFGLNDWLRLALVAEGAPLRIIDDGACATCANASGGRSPWADTFELAREVLSAAGVAGESLPAIVAAGTSPNGNQPAHPVDASVHSGRRGFLGGLTRAVASTFSQTASSPRPGPPANPAREQVAASRSIETRVLLARLARRHGRNLPVEFPLPRLELSRDCDAHGVCARVCPTGALQLAGDSDGMHFELGFDAWRCIECGACERNCPGHAVRVGPRAWRSVDDAREILVSRVLNECPRCGAAFAQAGDERLCPRCLKDERLARAGFALFQPRSGRSAASPEGP